MSKSINKVILCGRLGKDPNVRVLEQGAKVCDFSLATGGEEYTTKDGKEIKVPTQWHSIIAWNRLCEFAEKALKKGSAVTVFGEINYRKYQDSNGVERTTTDIIATDLFIGGASSGAQGGTSQAEAQAPQPEAPVSQEPAQGEKDDLPF